MEENYKTENFINGIAYGASLFVFFDLKTHFGRLNTSLIAIK